MIQTRIEDKLAEEILAGNVNKGDKVRVAIVKKEIAFQVKND